MNDISFVFMFLGEFLGTLVLVLLGNGVVANVVFKKTIGSNSGWIVITLGWGVAVFAGVAVANIFHTGGSINPAITLGLICWGKLKITHGLIYIGSEFLGAMAGQIIVNTFYWQHIKENDSKTILSMHSTGPTHPKAWGNNCFSEYVGTVVLAVMAFIAIQSSWFGQAPWAIALTVLVIGLSLGGTTGYAINPARDFGPRLVYLLTFQLGFQKIQSLKNIFKLKSIEENETISANLVYSWVPVVSPALAGISVGLLARLT